MNDTELMTRLAALDPEPERNQSTAELQRKAELLILLSADGGGLRVSKPRVRRRLVIAGAAVLVASLVTVGIVITRPQAHVSTEAMGAGTLSVADLSTWTSSPSPAATDASVVSSCAGHLSREPLALGAPTTILADLRGGVTSAIVSLGGYTGYCIEGSDPDAAFGLLADPQSSPPTTAPDQITLGFSGGHSVPGGYQFAEGTAGTSVTSITIHQDDLDIVASVGDGYWMAWWPLKDSDTSDPIVTGPFTVITADGSTKTYAAADIQAP